MAPNSHGRPGLLDMLALGGSVFFLERPNGATGCDGSGGDAPQTEGQTVNEAARRRVRRKMNWIWIYRVRSL